MTKQKILILSDAHIGGEISDFSAYQKHIIELMSQPQYTHIVIVGDWWELFYQAQNHVKQLSSMLEVVSDGRNWRKEFEPKGTARSAVENVIHGAALFTEEFLQKNPKVYLHVVGGNHESVRRFHNEFEKIQKNHPNNFEWSPQAIRVGDTLFTHGHLQMSKQTIEEYSIARLRDAENAEKWAKFLAFFATPDQKVHEWMRSPKKAIKRMRNQLEEWDGKEKFFVSRNGIHVPFTMEWVKHVFFGHTHVKFNSHEKDGVLYHNTGAIVEAVTSKHPEEPGILEADLNSDGTLANVRPVRVEKDRNIQSRPKPPSRA